MKNLGRAAVALAAALMLPTAASAGPEVAQWNTTFYLQFDFGGRARDAAADSFKLGLSGNLLSLESRLEAARAASARFNPQAFRATPAGLLQVEVQPAQPLNNALRIGGMDVLQRMAPLNADGAAAAEDSPWYSGATGWILAGGAVLIGLVAVAGNEAEDLGYGNPGGGGGPDIDGPGLGFTVIGGPETENCVMPLGDVCVFAPGR